MRYKYAILHKGQVIDYCDTPDQAKYWLSEPNTELVEIAKASKVVVQYTELSGPWGYGHQEESFATYGALLPCIRRLYTWIQEEARTFGPDVREIKDFFRHCRLYINGEDKSEWMWKQTSKLDLKTLYV